MLPGSGGRLCSVLWLDGPGPGRGEARARSLAFGLDGPGSAEARFETKHWKCMSI